MTGKVLMVQGTASHVGKSILVSALCRIFRQDGFRVAPFKAQNMSNNSYVTASGGEIGRAQAVQAEAAGVEAQVEMNPVLLKPEADRHSQVVVMGRPLLSASAKDYYGLKTQLWEAVRGSLDILREQYDIVVIEGAGSPAEINLKANEIVNMRVALYAKAPVLLCGDIDRGGVFAAIVGTLELLDPEERETIKGFVINKFRGDISLLDDGLVWLEQRTGIPVLGVVHHFRDIHIPEEDSVALDLPVHVQGDTVLDIVVVQLPHIANFDDFDPLARENGVSLRFVSAPEEIGSPDLIILPGTKTTIPDLAWMESQGLVKAIRQCHGAGAALIGVCGGYQMLGTNIYDPEMVESQKTEIAGLGLLPMTTVFAGSKETHRIRGTVAGDVGLLAGAQGLPIQGYEIHMGRTTGDGVTAPFSIEDRSDLAVTEDTATDGALHASGYIFGTYIHGLFHNGGLRRAMLQALAQRKGVTLPPDAGELGIDQEYDKLADWVRSSLDMDLIYQMTGLSRDFEAAGDPR
ncbi:MAG: cobyric acid synthase [Chloroflexi bacterium]|nr:cobyric acid synthase [Chloroflexota bacterium]